MLGPVQMPCNGTSQFGPWSVKSCSIYDMYGWQLWLSNWTAINHPEVDLTQFQHRAAVLPKQQTKFMLPADVCSFTGMSVIGPAVAASSYSTGVYSFLWISGDQWNQPQSWLHEISHNYYLAHADALLSPTSIVSD